jgi:hypothetical protein
MAFLHRFEPLALLFVDIYPPDKGQLWLLPYKLLMCIEMLWSLLF